MCARRSTELFREGAGRREKRLWMDASWTKVRVHPNTGDTKRVRYGPICRPVPGRTGAAAVEPAGLDDVKPILVSRVWALECYCWSLRRVNQWEIGTVRGSPGRQCTGDGSSGSGVLFVVRGRGRRCSGGGGRGGRRRRKRRRRLSGK